MSTDTKPIECRSYKVICISMFHEDLAEMDALVEELKRAGVPRANRSSLIRHALRLVDPSTVKELR